MSLTPIVYAKKVKEGLTFWCQYCSLPHYHSHEEGHRIAHCIKENSPYIETGYILKNNNNHATFISKRLRFKIFKRDCFRCVYCGAQPFDTKLQIDHKIPKSKGGSDLESNLVVACLDCNLGKSDIV